MEENTFCETNMQGSNGEQAKTKAKKWTLPYYLEVWAAAAHGRLLCYPASVQLSKSLLLVHGMQLSMDTGN